MNDTTSGSPHWGSTTKTVAAVTMIVLIAALLVQFRGIIPPLMMVFIVAYLFYPAATFLASRLHLSWGWAVNLIYLLLIIIVLGMLTVGGVGLVQQLQSLITLASTSLQALPTLIGQLSGQTIYFGPLHVDLSRFDLAAVSNQLLSAVEPFLGQTGSVVAAVASGAVNVLGWTLFVLLVSYFLLAESGGLWHGVLAINIPGYERDLERMGRQLAAVWNAFLRGQIIVMALAAVIYTIVLNVMGVSYAIGLAILAGLARFLPYIGPLILWIVLGLVTYFQDFKPFGLDPLTYALIIIALAWVIDAIVDNVVMPRVMADALQVHPAAVLVAALIAFELFGILGMVIAAPILATVKLFGQYTFNKMFDRDPWDGIEEKPIAPPLRQKMLAFWKRIKPPGPQKTARTDL